MVLLCLIFNLTVMVAVLLLYFVMCAFDDNNNQVFWVVSGLIPYNTLLYWPYTPTGHFLSGPSARHLLVRPVSYAYVLLSRRAFRASLTKRIGCGCSSELALLILAELGDRKANFCPSFAVVWVTEPVRIRKSFTYARRPLPLCLILTSCLSFIFKVRGHLNSEIWKSRSYNDVCRMCVQNCLASIQEVHCYEEL